MINGQNPKLSKREALLEVIRLLKLSLEDCYQALESCEDEPGDEESQAVPLKTPDA